jgi:hypothetical protein
MFCTSPIVVGGRRALSVVIVLGLGVAYASIAGALPPNGGRLLADVARSQAAHRSLVPRQSMIRSGSDLAGGTAPALARLYGLREVNYYPSAAGWSAMWTRWNRSAIDDDLAAIRTLGATAVRVFLQPSAVGYPRPARVMTSRIQEFFDDANAEHLAVHLTLFDWWDAYGDIAGSEAWARAVLRPLASRRNLAVVELKNEIDLGRPNAIRWANVMLAYLRSLLGRVLLTVSVSRTSGVGGLAELKADLGANQPDFYTFHYYGNPGLAYVTLSGAKAVAAPTPLFVDEFGASSLDPRGSVAGDARQSLALRTVAAAVRALGLPDPAPWTVNDFAPGAIPPSATATDPSQYHMGLFTTHRSSKPSADAIRRLFRTGAVATSFNNSFESGVRAGGGSLPTQWSIVDPDAAQFAQDPQVAHSGSASARISDSAGTASVVPAFEITPPLGWVTPGQSYRASVWARGTNATGASRLAIAWFSGTGAYLGQVQSTSLRLGTSSWTLLTAQGSAPAATAYVEIHLKSSDNGGSVWFDDVTWSS